MNYGFLCIYILFKDIKNAENIHVQNYTKNAKYSNLHDI